MGKRIHPPASRLTRFFSFHALSEPGAIYGESVVGDTNGYVDGVVRSTSDSSSI